MLKQIQRRKVNLERVPETLERALKTKSPDADAALLMQRILLARGIQDEQALDFSLTHLLPFSDLKGIEDAVRLLATAIQQQWSILIIGDYDADGATAATVGLLGLKEMGAAHVDYLVPNRFEYGYGLSPEIAEVAVEKKPDLVITVDNGISSIEGVKRLRDAGIEVLITDHHLPANALPDASVIVNPNQFGCEFSSKALAGVGVMFYVLMALRHYLLQQTWFTAWFTGKPNLAQYLDLVALGTVADLVPLDANNRILVAQGVARIRAGKCSLGIKALLHGAGKTLQNVVSQDLGFVVAPRLNAAGRLDDISIGIECLLCREDAEANKYAQLLEQTNSQRKAIEKQMQAEAMQYVKNLELKQFADNQKIQGVCLYQEDWHQGVTGLIASRIKDYLAQPCIVFAPTNNGDLTGSARSIKGLHIKDLLEQISRQYPGLIIKFGGHAMAAGLTIEKHKIEAFKQAFDETVRAICADMTAGHVLLTDGEVPAKAMTIQTAAFLRHAYPWGQGVEAPIFDAVFKVKWCKIVGQVHIKMQLLCEGSGQEYDAIAFRALNEGDSLPEMSQIHAVYRLDVNEFRGQSNLQLLIEHFEPCV